MRKCCEPSKATRYNNEKSLAEDEEHANDRLARLSKGLPPECSWASARTNLLPVLLSHCVGGDCLSVLDVGGGMGLSYMDLRYSCPDLVVKYCVCELPETVDLSRGLFDGDDRIEFVVDFPAGRHFDVVYFASSLQYVLDYKDMIAKSCALRPDLVFLTDHTVGDAETFVCAQVNMRNRVIPRYVFNSGELVELFRECEYSLVHRSVNYYPFHNFSNYEGPPPRRNMLTWYSEDVR